MIAALDTQTILMYLVRLMIVLLINPLHECAHAWTAHKLGDDTAKYQGRMTLDPIAHIEPFGALLMMFAGIGWAKPVPVNPANFKHKNFDMLLVAVAGPFSNLAAAFLGIIAIRLCGGFETFIDYGRWLCFPDGSSMGFLFYMLYEFVNVNIILFLFNMIPVPPLDGSRVLIYFLPPKAAVWFMKYSRVFYGITFLLMITGILTLPLYLGRQYIACGMCWLVSFLPAVM